MGFRHTAVLIAAGGLVGFAGTPWAAPIDPVTATGTSRGAALALPAVYRVSARFEVMGVRLGNGTMLRLPPAGRHVTEVGTAFAVSPDGVLVTAAHVAAPDAARLALVVGRLALQQRGEEPDDAYVRAWVDMNRARAVGVRALGVEVEAAMADVASPRVDLAATVVPGGRSADDDLVLLRIPTGGVPSLLLDESETVGTPVATIGFGAPDPVTGLGAAPLPTVRLGALGRTGATRPLSSQLHTVVTTAVQQGDSGGPAVDAAGHVRGVVRWRSPAAGGGVLVQSWRVRALMQRRRIVGGEGAAQTAYRRGLEAVWSGRPTAAQQALADAARAYRGHALAATARTSVEHAAGAGFTARGAGWRDGLLLGLGSMFGLVAAALWWWRRRLAGGDRWAPTWLRPGGRR